MTRSTSAFANHRRIILIVVVLIFFLCGIVTIESLKGYHDELRRAAADTQSLANAVAQNAVGTIGRVDLLLAKTQEVLFLKESVKKINQKELSELLRQQQAAVPEVEAVGVTDDLGNYIGNTTWMPKSGQPFIIPKINASDRNYFKRHRDDPKLDSLITEPVISRSTGNMVVAVVRKRLSKNGKFAGVIFATLNLKYFSTLFEKIDPGSNDVAALWNMDRTLLSRHPFNRENVGRYIPAPLELKEQMANGQRAGNFTSTSVLDGIRRVYSFRVVDELSLLVTVGRGESEVLANWWRHLIVIASLITFLVVLTAVSLHYHFQDLRELDRQRAIAFQSTKMSALGEMAAGIAHEINNPLAIISGRASQIMMMLEAGDLNIGDMKQKTDRIIQTTMRVARIIKGLRSFARNSGQDPMVDTKVATIFDNTLELSRERFKAAGIDLKVLPIPDCSIACREAQISQVLINLLNNSFDAISEQKEPWVELETKDLGSAVQISVTDSGGGIEPDIAEKLMQPFFTTKPLDKGTGLGLSISKGIIEEHGGSFVLDSFCKNTRFVILLPKISEKAEQES
jgi:signal transduction histidine kinase